MKGAVIEVNDQEEFESLQIYIETMQEDLNVHVLQSEFSQMVQKISVNGLSIHYFLYH